MQSVEHVIDRGILSFQQIDLVALLLDHAAEFGQVSGTYPVRIFGTAAKVAQRIHNKQELLTLTTETTATTHQVSQMVCESQLATCDLHPFAAQGAVAWTFVEKPVRKDVFRTSGTNVVRLFQQLPRD